MAEPLAKDGFPATAEPLVVVDPPTTAAHPPIATPSAVPLTTIGYPAATRQPTTTAPPRGGGDHKQIRAILNTEGPEGLIVRCDIVPEFRALRSSIFEPLWQRVFADYMSPSRPYVDLADYNRARRTRSGRARPRKRRSARLCCTLRRTGGKPRHPKSWFAVVRRYVRLWAWFSAATQRGAANIAAELGEYAATEELHYLAVRQTRCLDNGGGWDWGDCAFAILYAAVIRGAPCVFRALFPAYVAKYGPTFEGRETPQEFADLAADFGQTRIVRYLGRNFPLQSARPLDLEVAARRGHVSLVRYYLAEMGAELDTADLRRALAATRRRNCAKLDRAELGPRQQRRRVAKILWARMAQGVKHH